MSKDGKRTFYASHLAWYGKQLYDQAEIMFGIDGGEYHGEMAMRWHDIKGWVPRLEVFDDAWATLAQLPDVVAALAERDNENVTPEEFMDILKELGFEDVTTYENPHLPSEPQETLEQELVRLCEALYHEGVMKIGDAWADNPVVTEVFAAIARMKNK